MSASFTVFQGSTSKDFSSWCLLKQGISIHIYVGKKYSKKTKTQLTNRFTLDTVVRPGVSSKICKT